MINYYESEFQYTAGKSQEVEIRIRSRKIVKKLISIHPEGRTLLDVGSGFGYFLDVAKKEGLNVIGIEPSKALSVQSSELLGRNKIYNNSFEAYYKNLRSRKFDFITLIHIIEHVPEPRKFIKKISRLLNKDGILYIETPNADSWLQKVEKEQYTFLTPPDHIWIFSPKSLIKMLSQSSFTIKSLSTYSYPEHLIGIVKKLIHPNRIISIYESKSMPKRSQTMTNNQRMKYILFDKILAPLFTRFINIGNKGSIIELYNSIK